MLLFIPSSLIRRLGFDGSGVVDGPDPPRIFAHRRCWASFIRLRAATENCLRLRGGAPGVPAWFTDQTLPGSLPIDAVGLPSPAFEPLRRISCACGGVLSVRRRVRRGPRKA